MKAYHGITRVSGVPPLGSSCRRTKKSRGRDRDAIYTTSPRDEDRDFLYKGVDLLSTGQLFQFFQDGFDYTSTSGLRFSTVSGSLRLQFRLLTSGPRFEKNSALRAACIVLYNCIL